MLKTKWRLHCPIRLTVSAVLPHQNKAFKTAGSHQDMPVFLKAVSFCLKYNFKYGVTIQSQYANNSLAGVARNKTFVF
jgi:hypothetical protein